MTFRRGGTGAKVVAGVGLLAFGVLVGVLVAGSVSSSPSNRPETELVLIPVEGLLDRVRTLAEPDYHRSWSGTGYEYLDLQKYLVEWYLRAPDEVIQLGGWEFGVCRESVDSGLPDGALLLLGSSYDSQIIGRLHERRTVRIVMWTRPTQSRVDLRDTTSSSTE